MTRLQYSWSRWPPLLLKNVCWVYSRKRRVPVLHEFSLSLCQGWRMKVGLMPGLCSRVFVERSNQWESYSARERWHVSPKSHSSSLRLAARTRPRPGSAFLLTGSQDWCKGLSSVRGLLLNCFLLATLPCSCVAKFILFSWCLFT